MYVVEMAGVDVMDSFPHIFNSEEKRKRVYYICSGIKESNKNLVLVAGDLELYVGIEDVVAIAALEERTFYIKRGNKEWTEKNLNKELSGGYFIKMLLGGVLNIFQTLGEKLYLTRKKIEKLLMR